MGERKTQAVWGGEWPLGQGSKVLLVTLDRDRVTFTEDHYSALTVDM